MIFKCFLLFSCLVLAINCQSTNWCQIKNCKTNEHIACNNRNVFASSCVNPKAYPLSGAQKQKFLDMHNGYRNTVALGKLPRFSPAKRMAKVSWNNELATFAEMNTKQCKMSHDACHNTLLLKFSGQNLAWMGGSYNIDQAIQKSMEMWFNEHVNANMNNINKFGTSSGGKAIGHFTALATDRTTQIGCAISSYRSGTWDSFLVACNYASTNMVGWPVYKTGSSGSACKLGRDSKYPGLCNQNEPIDPNSNSN